MPRKKKEKVDMESENVEFMEKELDLVRFELEKAKIELEEKRKEIESTPSRKYDEKEIKISEKQVTMSSERQALKEKIEQQRKIDKIQVTGKFLNRRAPGQPAKLTYMKYEDDPVKWYFFEDGRTYTIPRGFADQINDYYHTPSFIPRDQSSSLAEQEGSQSPIAFVDTSNKKYAFVSVGF